MPLLSGQGIMKWVEKGKAKYFIYTKESWEYRKQALKDLSYKERRKKEHRVKRRMGRRLKVKDTERQTELPPVHKIQL